MQIKILTFNVGLLKVFNWVFTPYIEERFSHLAETLSGLDADIVALQEIYDNKFKKYLIDQLKSKYPYAFHNKQNRFLNLKTDGLVILSKYKIVDSKIGSYRKSPLEEKVLVKKGYIYSSVQLPNNSILGIINTHLTAGGVFNHPESEKSNQYRNTQIDELSKTVINNQMCIVLGDFNCGPSVSPDNYLKLLSFGWLSCFDYLHKNRNGFTWDVTNNLNKDSPHSTSPSQRIDHIFLTKETKSIFDIMNCNVVFDEKVVPIDNNKKVTVSDHYGLVVTIKNK